MIDTVKPKCVFKGAKVLVAEDNDFSLEVIKHMLKLFGIQADHAIDGVETVAMAQKKDYDLIILDIHMPNKDGNQAAREIREMEIKQPILVALTASAFESGKAAIMAAGFDAYYSKPLELDGLEEMLKKHLKNRMVSE